MTHRRQLWAAIFMAVPFTVYTVFVTAPTLYTFYFSLTDWKVTKPKRSFIGLENYTELFADSEFWHSVRVTLIWTVVGVLVSVVLGFLLSLAVSRVVNFDRLTKSMFFLPLALSLVVVGFAWTWIYRGEDGFINLVLGWFGQTDLERAWLTDASTALAAVIIAWLWQQIPLSMVIYLAGLTAVPKELIESATIDGASYVRRVWHVVIPSVRASTVVVVSLALINSLRSFDIVYVMTKGGPYDTTQTLAIMSYEQAFKRYAFGEGSATAVVLFVLTLAVVGLFTWVAGRGQS